MFFFSRSKQNCLNIWGTKHLALSDTTTSGIENAVKTLSLSLSALIVAKVVASLTRISHTNFENESTH
jgi:hypothetical protein